MSAAALPPYVLPLLYGLGSLLIAVAGRHRKWGFWGYLWASLLMSPVMGLLFLLAGDKPARRVKPAKPADPAKTVEAPAPVPVAAGTPSPTTTTTTPTATVVKP